MTQENHTYVLTAQCKSEIGTVDAITHLLYQRKCYINEIQSFDDKVSKEFFFRAEFINTAQDEMPISQLEEEIAPQAEKFDMQWEIRPLKQPTKLLILVSKFDHCLNDLLYRYRTGDLNVEIPAIISNHPDLEDLAKVHDIPYYHFPITKETKPEQEAKILEVLKETGADLVVLARYMQVLSDDMCRSLNGKAINIHHSLLPGFKGAKPYHQAFDKGVKLVGATAHFVSSDLDEGPIIAQGVEAVDHTYTPEKLVAKGRDIESLTLARAIRMYAQHRIFLNGDKTIVFPQG